jgi:hypothetical protein
MLKSILAIVFGFLCLVIVAAGSSEAKGRSGGRHRSTHSSHGRRPTHVQQHKHHHKHHHKHKSRGDVDGGGSDGPSAEAGDAGETEAAVGATEDDEETEASVYGVEITALYKGTAAKEGLEIGDIILSFNGIPTPNFDALASAVARSGSQAQVLVVRGEDGERETITLFPQQGRIGLSGEGVRVNK